MIENFYDSYRNVIMTEPSGLQNLDQEIMVSSLKQ